MTKDERLKVGKEEIRKRLLKYTRKAFRMLPQMDKPRILDIGCGSGVSTLELARLTDGEITGLDIDQNALDRLKRKIETGRWEKTGRTAARKRQIDSAGETRETLGL